MVSAGGPTSVSAVVLDRAPTERGPPSGHSATDYNLDIGAEVGIYTGVAFAFIRLSTNRRVFSHPLSVNDAFAYLNNWLSFPAVKWVTDTVEDYRTVETLLKSAGTASNLVSDAQIAAVALRLHATVHSSDADFDRFPKLNWKNPLN